MKPIETVYKVDNPKGFLILKMMGADTQKIGGNSTCDWCGEISTDGYYISVLNMWYCDKCYNDWLQRAKRFESDILIEEKNYSKMCHFFKIE